MKSPDPPEEYVTITEIAQRLGCARTVVSGWYDRGMLKKWGKKKTNGAWAGTFRWSDIVALKYVHGSSFKYADMVPEGHIAATEAAGMLGVSAPYLRNLIRLGKFKGKSVPFPGCLRPGSKRRLMSFANKQAVLDAVAAKGQEKQLRDLCSTNDDSRPLISSRNPVCLDARQRLWEANGRVMLRKYRISVAARKAAG